MVVKIATLNLCLGLQNKKTLIQQIVLNEKIDLLCLQETELNKNLDHNLLSFRGYCYESENNSALSRVGIYIKSELNYVRRSELEGINSHLIILDVVGTRKFRLINLYRCFNPLNHVTPRDFFRNQLNLIKAAYTRNTIVLGDFNLDWAKKGNHSYPFKRDFEDMDEIFNELNFDQLVNFPTWSRMVNNIHKESILDHIYVTNPLSTTNIMHSKPTFGDHEIITFNYDCMIPRPEKIIKRNWVNYDKDKLIEGLSKIDWKIQDDSVQGYWNQFENKILEVVDNLIPMQVMYNGIECNPKPPSNIKHKINIRKRLLQRYKINKTCELKTEIKILDKHIKQYFNENKSRRVRKIIIPGNTNSLWKAVKTAMDINVSNLPKTLFEKKIEVPTEDLPDRFAEYFDTKIKKVLEEVNIDENVYNGKRLIEDENKNFMDPASVKECIKNLKIKNSEGVDRIPQRILVDGVEILCEPISNLMEMIYVHKTVPDQWLIAKTIPVYTNKGTTKDMENYRPIANLCSTSKVFEKLILKRILEIQTKHKVDLTGNNQHGFKKSRSTSTLSIQLQSMIARAMDEDQYGMVASLDLSSAFDVVNIDLLIKRLKIVGLPDDVVNLIKVWLINRSFYVSVDGENSILYDLL